MSDKKFFQPIHVPYLTLGEVQGIKVQLRIIAGTPTDGTSGTAAGQAGKGSLLIDSTNNILYTNAGTLASPSWEPAAGSANIAIEVRNETGLTIEDGDLVYLSGWNETEQRMLIDLADADVRGKPAEYIIRTDITTAANGLAFKTYRETGGIDLDGKVVGDPLFLSTTAGDATLTDPTDSDPNALSQIVGRAAIIATDVTEYDLTKPVTQIGTNEIQDGAIDETKLGISLPITLALPFTLDFRGGAQSDGMLIGRLDHQAVDACVTEDSSGGPGFTDETTDANSAGTGDVTLQDPFETGDAIYVGMSNKFSAIKVKIDQAGASTGDAEAESLWEYSQGSTSWASLEATAELKDDTVAFEAGTSEYIVSFIPPSDWETETVNAQGPYYYIRLRATANDIWDTTQAILTQLWALELTVGQGIVIPMAGTISAVDMTALTASGTTDDSEFLLINLTTGLWERITWTKADEIDRVTGLSLVVNAGDELVLQMLVDDTSTEFADASFTLQLDF